MKILLSTPPGETTELWPPLGLLYIASNVRTQRDDDIKVIDAFCENLSKDALIDRIFREKPDIFGMNCSTHTFLSSIEALGDIRKILPDTILVLGGYHATFAAERILREYPFVDFIIKGEAEYAFPQLLQCIESGTRACDVEGISFMENGNHISNPLTLINDLDSLPFPDRELAQRVEYGYFHRNIRLTFGKFTTICTSRGCPYKCTYCSCTAFSQRKWRPRSAENVVDEIESIYSQGYECCVVVDDNLTHKRKRIEKICELIRSRKIKMQFYCEGRVDNASYSMLRNMKRAGFNVIYFGAESASQHVLDYYNKTITPAQAKKSIENAKRAGMVVVTSFIFGAPVESREDILNTVNFIRETRPHAIQINILDCLLGTPIWDDLLKDGAVRPDDWKTNHRIYEFNNNGLSRDELQELVQLGYAAYADAWKNKDGLRDFIKIMTANKSARSIIFGNIVNPRALRGISGGVQAMRNSE